MPRLYGALLVVVKRCGGPGSRSDLSRTVLSVLVPFLECMRMNHHNHKACLCGGPIVVIIFQCTATFDWPCPVIEGCLQEIKRESQSRKFVVHRLNATYIKDMP